MTEGKRTDERIDAALRRWGGRPPETAPAVAAARLRARLRDEREAPRRGRLWPAVPAAAAAALALATVILRFGGHAGVGPALPVSNGPGLATWQPAPVDPGVVVIPLDDGTTLYMSLEAAGGAATRLDDPLPNSL